MFGTREKGISFFSVKQSEFRQDPESSVLVEENQIENFKA